jgi:hypothetical protein
MKTTIDIADDLLSKARNQAKREKKTLKQVVEEALRRHLTSAPQKAKFRYKPVTFRGTGIRPGLSEGDWGALRDLAYGMDEGSENRTDRSRS